MPSWHHTDLTAAAGIPANAFGSPTSFFDPTAFFYPTRAAYHVFYRGDDNHIHQLRWKSGVWQYANLTNLAWAGILAEPAGNPTSFFDPTGPAYHVFYPGLDSCIHELLWQGGVWHHNNLTTAASAPAYLQGNPTCFSIRVESVFLSIQYQYVFYPTWNSRIHALWWAPPYLFIHKENRPFP